MKNALIIGTSKTGTTIVASVIQRSIPDARLLVEPRTVALLEKLRRHDVPWVVKMLYEHWRHRPFLLNGIVRGEAGFAPDRTVAIVRDPRDGLVSALMYRAYECVLEGAGERQVEQWVAIIREKEANPEKYSVVGLVAALARVFNVGDTPDSFFETFLSYSRWIAENRDRFHVLRYEDFVAGETAQLAAYLGIALSPSREVDPTLRRVARTRRSGGWRAIMLPEDVAYLKERFGATLDAQGYRDWETHPERTDPAAGSDYILRITREAFASLRERPAGQLGAPAQR